MVLTNGVSEMLRAFNRFVVPMVSVLFLLVSFSAFAEKKWISLAVLDDGTKWEAKPGSFEFKKNRSGIPIAVLTGRVVNTKPSTIDLRKWYVTAGDCKNKMGKLVSLDVSGEYQHENDFLFDSGSVASSIAQFICEVAEESIKQADGKSL